MNIVLSPEAKASISQAIDWYLSEGGQALAARAAKAFRSAVMSIAKAPRQHPPYPEVPGVRRKVMSRFPYLLFFVVDGEKIVVLEVLHVAKQAPTGFPSGRAMAER